MFYTIWKKWHSLAEASPFDALRGDMHMFLHALFLLFLFVLFLFFLDGSF